MGTPINDQAPDVRDVPQSDVSMTLNAVENGNIIYEKIINSEYDAAINLTKAQLTCDKKHEINEIVTKLLDNNKKNIMSYAYKLWHSGAKDIVTEYFPSQFKLIFNEDPIYIINKGYDQALKLDAKTDDDKDRLAWGDSHDKTSKRVSWKIIPVWKEDKVVFKLYNIDRNMYLKLVVTPDNKGDRKVYGSTSSGEDRHNYYLEPWFKNGELVFFIINCQYDQALKLGLAVDTLGDRHLWGHNGSYYNNEKRFKWTIASFENSRP